ncbi:MAG: hypothetical protein JRF33_04620 [Deltaproteobacteria bacterium]|nr:hypothetical protein [Deltaproteobacteria bacterium]
MRRTSICSGIILSLLLAACGSSESESEDAIPLTAKILNAGPYTMTAFYVQPTGSMPETGWETMDWGENKLTVAQLTQLQFVRVDSLDRLEYDAVAAFDADGATELLRGYVHAGWISDGPFISISAALSADSNSFGYQWGEEIWEGEQDVTP